MKSWTAIKAEVSDYALDPCYGEARDDVLIVYCPDVMTQTALDARHDLRAALQKASGLPPRFMIRRPLPRIERLNEFAKAVHENAVEHGFWTPPPSFGEVVALCHSELSEALEAYRSSEPMLYYSEDGKPEGIAVEMADAIIRIFDWFGSHEGLDLAKILTEKVEYNRSRPYRHGGKKL